MNGILSRYRLRNTLIAGGLALVGAILVFAYVASYRKNVQHGAKLVTVFVAARDIPEGTDGASAAGAKYMRKESVLRRNVVDGAVSNPNQVSGLAAAQTIFTGEQITVRQFRSAAQQGVLANISGNLRAMTIPGDDNQLLSNVVKDGDHIDVLASIKYSLQGNGAGNGGGFNRVAARVILRNLLVLRAPSGASGRGINNSSKLHAGKRLQRPSNFIFATAHMFDDGRHFP